MFKKKMDWNNNKSKVNEMDHSRIEERQLMILGKRGLRVHALMKNDEQKVAAIYGLNNS